MVNADEAMDALDPQVGDGDPDSAPAIAPKAGLLGEQPTLVLGGVVTVATALLASPALPLPAWLKTVLSVAVAVAGVFGIYSRVTPVANPKLDAQTPLTP